ncbi:MAG TPA: hypothetical protein VKU60_18775, partial [Chloroflexota bacterium]|nr:hypothetical protein [Chloroflexota bacterium]
TFGFHLVPTYDLLNASYDSPYISFTTKEIKDHQNNAFQPLDPTEQSYIDRYDPKASFPFLIINGQYALSGPGRAGYSPAVIDGQTFDEVKQQLDTNADTPAVKAINGEAQIIAKYICASTGGVPASVCKA